MKATQIITDNILLAKAKTDKLIADINSDDWLTTHDVLKTNINWQIGHVIVANYLHGIASITGSNAEFKQMVDVPSFVKFYGPNSKPNDFLDEKPSTANLLDIYEKTFTLIQSAMFELDEVDLDADTAIPNPAVKTKYQALMWMAQHQSWHNGQIATLKRVLKGKKS